MKRNIFVSTALAISSLALTSCDTEARATAPAGVESVLAAEQAAEQPSLARGRSIFRFDTFGDETFWTDTLRMHEVIRTGVSPATALAVGLKVDLGALPLSVRAALKAGQINLNDPAVTVTLLKLGAVVGDRLKSMRITTQARGRACAMSSTVENASLRHRRSPRGWPNRDLNGGAIIALSRRPRRKKPHQAWGPGMYDPRFSSTARILHRHPACLGCDVSREVYTGDGAVSYWNAYAPSRRCTARTFFDAAYGVSVNNRLTVSSKLDALRAYQFSLTAPRALPGSFDPAAAERGKAVFVGAAKCATCHTGQIFTDVNAGKLHSPAEVGQDAAYAQRTVTKLYRTTPLRGLWRLPQLDGPYFHDGKREDVTVSGTIRRALQPSAPERQKKDLAGTSRTLSAFRADHSSPRMLPGETMLRASRAACRSAHCCALRGERHG